MEPKLSLNPKSKQQGAVLIISLWILAILTLLAISIGRRISIELRLLKYHLNRTQAFYLAKAGLEHIYAQKAGDSNEYDSLNEAWSNKLKDDQKTPYFKDFKEFSWGNGEFEVKYDYYETTNQEAQTLYGMQDESSKLNINKILNADGKVNDERKKEFTQLIENVLGYSSKAQEMTDKFIDWIDNDNSRSDNGKEDYSEKGISPKNAPLDRLEELTMIDGFSLEDVKKLSQYITIYGDGEINVNTAPKEILMALGLNESTINGIIDYRQGKDGQTATEDDGLIKTISFQNTNSQAENYINISNEDITSLNTLGSNNRIKTFSSYYKAKSTGTVNKIKKEITTVIQTNQKQHPQGLYWYEE